MINLYTLFKVSLFNNGSKIASVLFEHASKSKRLIYIADSALRDKEEIAASIADADVEKAIKETLAERFPSATSAQVYVDSRNFNIHFDR